MNEDGDDGLPFEDLALAKHGVEQAESALEALLEELQRRPRAQKVAVSASIEAALQRLSDARAILDPFLSLEQRPSEKAPY